MQRLKEAAEKAKIELSGVTTTNINLPYITADATGPKHLDVTLTRAKFNELTAHLVEATMGPVRQAMSDAGLSSQRHLQGAAGGRLQPYPRRAGGRQEASPARTASRASTPMSAWPWAPPFRAACCGGDVKGLLLLDVTPLSLGIETMGGVFTKLIERNTTIPAKKSQIFSTAADNQTSVEVHVLQGEREMAAYNKTLGRFHLDGIAPARRGVPQIEVTFDIDANGIVNVSAKDLGTGKEQNITITSSTNMSKEDIDKAVKEAEQFAAEDAKRKEEVDIRNQADQMVYQTEKTLERAGRQDLRRRQGHDRGRAEQAEGGPEGHRYRRHQGCHRGAAPRPSTPSPRSSISRPTPSGRPGYAGGAAGGARQRRRQGGDGNVVDADYEVVDDDKNE